MRSCSRIALLALVSLVCFAAFAAVVPQPGRFDHLVVHDPSALLGTAGETPDQIQGFDAGRAGWTAFRQAHGSAWRVWVDRRSGSPLLATGPGINWFATGQPVTTAQLEDAARRFVTSNERLLGVVSGELAWNPQGSGATDLDHHVLVFDRVVAGVPVEGEQFVLYVTRGSLTSFGATRWGSIPTVPQPALDASAAWDALRAYMALGPQDSAELVEYGQLVLLPVPPGGGGAGATLRYEGPAGGGVTHLLAWRFAVRVDGEAGTWIGKVDAQTGRVIAFFDGDLYDVKGGVYPMSNDQNCGEFGCELAGYPMPYVSVSIAKKQVRTDDMGTFTCGKGAKNSTVRLTGPYVTVSDICGTATVSGNCSNDLDFGASAGTDCTVPAGQSAGDTHAGRSSYYHLNRVKEKARYWLPSNAWVDQLLTDKVNINSTCNAYWNGSVNFYKSGGGCRNTGEIAGVVVHEWGHGMDQNDGGGSDNPSEAYADVVSILQDRRSCVGRGFFASGTCSGYGDSCLNCTGIRDMDWDQRVRHTPATPANFTMVNCGGGGGPCGREVHCESYVPSEAIFDLAFRDLPAAGLDANSAWQLAEKLFYKSRQGSGGSALNCALPSSDGCNVSSWFNKLRNADDDDGNLANGTPHAGAIFAAFGRHAIACGLATDPSNQSTSTCPALAAPVLSATPGAGQVTLSWVAVPGADNYLVLRNDTDCATTSNVIATVPARDTSYVDAGLPAGFGVYYRVQAQGANVACDGPVSACVPSAAQ